jgi:hypothetical protein
VNYGQKGLLRQVFSPLRTVETATKKAKEGTAVARIQFFERRSRPALKIEHQDFVAAHDVRCISFTRSGAAVLYR